jgi:hypothetical protein
MYKYLRKIECLRCCVLKKRQYTDGINYYSLRFTSSGIWGRRFGGTRRQSTQVLSGRTAWPRRYVTRLLWIVAYWISSRHGVPAPRNGTFTNSDVTTSDLAIIAFTYTLLCSPFGSFHCIVFLSFLFRYSFQTTAPCSNRNWHNHPLPENQARVKCRLMSAS